METYRVQAMLEITVNIHFSIDCEAPPGQKRLQEFQQLYRERLTEIAENIEVAAPPDCEMIEYDVVYTMTHFELENEDGRQGVETR